MISVGNNEDINEKYWRLISARNHAQGVAYRLEEENKALSEKIADLEMQVRERDTDIKWWQKSSKEWEKAYKHVKGEENRANEKITVLQKEAHEQQNRYDELLREYNAYKKAADDDIGLWQEDVAKWSKKYYNVADDLTQAHLDVGWWKGKCEEKEKEIKFLKESACPCFHDPRYIARLTDEVNQANSTIDDLSKKFSQLALEKQQLVNELEGWKKECFAIRAREEYLQKDVQEAQKQYNEILLERNTLIYKSVALERQYEMLLEAFNQKCEALRAWSAKANHLEDKQTVLCGYIDRLEKRLNERDAAITLLEDKLSKVKEVVE